MDLGDFPQWIANAASAFGGALIAIKANRRDIDRHTGILDRLEVRIRELEIAKG